MLYIICNLRNIQKTEMAEFRVIHQSWVEKSAAWFASHGFDVLPTRISLLPLFILTLRDLGLKKEGSLWSMKIDIASPHEQMSNSTVTISTTFFQSAAMYSWNNEDIHTHFTPLASKIQKKVWNILCFNPFISFNFEFEDYLATIISASGANSSILCSLGYN